MILPNLLNMALTLVPQQSVQWFRYLGSVTQPNGLDVSSFDAGVIAYGSFQPVAKSAYQTLGLDFSKEYVRLFTSTPIVVLGRNIAGDEFVFAGNRYHVMDNTEWLNVNGWNENMAVRQ